MKMLTPFLQVKIRQRKHLSEMDIQEINLLYKCSEFGNYLKIL